MTVYNCDRQIGVARVGQLVGDSNTDSALPVGLDPDRYRISAQLMPPPDSRGYASDIAIG